MSYSVSASAKLQLQIVGRVLQCGAILLLGVGQQTLLPIRRGAHQVGRAGFAHQLLRVVHLVERLLRLAQVADR